MHTNIYSICGYALTNEIRNTCLWELHLRLSSKWNIFRKLTLWDGRGEVWTNSIEREVLADRLTKVLIAFSLIGERLGTIPPQQTRPWGITQLSIRSFHSDEWGLSRCFAENWREKQKGGDFSYVCPFPPLDCVRQVIKR